MTNGSGSLKGCELPRWLQKRPPCFLRDLCGYLPDSGMNFGQEFWAQLLNTAVVAQQSIHLTLHI